MILHIQNWIFISFKKQPCTMAKNGHQKSIKVCTKVVIASRNTPKYMKHTFLEDHLKTNQLFLSHFLLSEKRENTESVSESEQLMSQGQYLRVWWIQSKWTVMWSGKGKTKHGHLVWRRSFKGISYFLPNKFLVLRQGRLRIWAINEQGKNRHIFESSTDSSISHFSQVCT